MRLGELRPVLAEHGQRLSLDPPGDPTLGECLLDDLSGPLRHRFGTMRDLVLGVSVVLADGLRANSGGKVVKNVAGYDLGKLFCGSRGRLGFVARVALRVRPLPLAPRRPPRSRASGGPSGPLPRAGSSCTTRSACRAPSPSSGTSCTSCSRAR